MHYPSWIFLTTCLTLVLTSGGLWLENQLQGRPQAVAHAAPESAEPVVTEHQVLITGAVVRPGIYRLPAQSKVAQLLQQAGGALPEARLGEVILEKTLQAGEVVHIPAQPEKAPAAQSAAAPQIATKATAAAPVGRRVALNTASPQELEDLPGVGPALAARIVSHRQQQGPFRTPEDLLEVKGIGEKKLAKMREAIQL